MLWADSEHQWSHDLSADTGIGKLSLLKFTTYLPLKLQTTNLEECKTSAGLNCIFNCQDVQQSFLLPDKVGVTYIYSLLYNAIYKLQAES